MLVCEVNSPLPCSATNIKYAVKSGGQRCSAEFAAVNEEVDMVLHVHTLLFGFIVGHGIFASAIGMISPAVLVLIA